MLGFNVNSIREDDTFTFENNTISARVYAIFRQTWVSPTMVLGLKPIDINVITDPEKLLDYQELVNDIEANPRKIIGLRLISDNINNFDNGWNWQDRDANGELKTITDFPINTLSSMQFQSRVIEIDYEGIIVGNNQFVVVIVEPFSSIRVTFKYDYIRREELLNYRDKKLNLKRKF